MNIARRAALSLTLSALTGCAETPSAISPLGAIAQIDTTPGTTPDTTTTPLVPSTLGLSPPVSADESLRRLRALEVIEVGEMTVRLPSEATNCYGPCPGSEGLIARARQEATARLSDFVVRAERAAALEVRPESPRCSAQAIDANLASLRSLEVVDVQGLLGVHAENHASPYSRPTEGDLADAERTRCARAQRLAAITDATRTP